MDKTMTDTVVLTIEQPEYRQMTLESTNMRPELLKKLCTLMYIILLILVCCFTDFSSNGYVKSICIDMSFMHTFLFFISKTRHVILYIFTNIIIQIWFLIVLTDGISSSSWDLIFWVCCAQIGTLVFFCAIIYVIAASINDYCQSYETYW